MSTARPESTWIEAAGGRMHARRWLGASGAPPVVLVHGMVVSGDYMVPTAELLARSFPVWVPDLPGYGRSFKPRRVLGVSGLADALAAWMAAAGIGRAALLGNSYGCQVVAELAARRPELVERVVLVGPTVDPRARSFWAQLPRWIADAPNERFSLYPILLRDYVIRAGIPRVLATIREVLADRIEEKLPRVCAPALVVRGSRDTIAPRAWTQEVARLLPMGRYAEVPGGSHGLNHGAPAELVALVRPFLEEGAGATRPAA